MSKGVVLRCDADGVVAGIVRDELGLHEVFEVGRAFAACVDRHSLGKALDFLLALRGQGWVSGWELNVRVDQQLRTLCFAGVLDGCGVLIAAAPTLGDLNGLGAWTLPDGQHEPDALEGKRHRDEPQDSLFDQISRLNNELVNLQRQLTKQNAELERLNLLKNEFLGMAAHDLRTPLGAITAYSEFLAEDLDAVLRDEHREWLEVIRSSSEYMSRLVDGILDVALSEAGKLSLSPEPTAMSDLVARCVVRNRILASRKNSILKLESAGPLPVLWVDPARIEQVVGNLISNAAKFSPPKSTITVRARPHDGGVLLSVQDEGPGLRNENLDQLLQPFRTGAAVGTRSERSTGLGLAIVKRVVEGHGGRVWVTSVEGEGATFHVFLPNTKGETQT